MQVISERAEDLNDRANTLWGYVLLGRADSGDIAEFERTLARFHDEIVAGAPFQYDDRLADEWLMSPAARDYLPDSEA